VEGPSRLRNWGSSPVVRGKRSEIFTVLGGLAHNQKEKAKGIVRKKKKKKTKNPKQKKNKKQTEQKKTQKRKNKKKRKTDQKTSCTCKFATPHQPARVQPGPPETLQTKGANKGGHESGLRAFDQTVTEKRPIAERPRRVDAASSRSFRGREKCGGGHSRRVGVVGTSRGAKDARVLGGKERKGGLRELKVGTAGPKGRALIQLDKKRKKKAIKPQMKR